MQTDSAMQVLSAPTLEDQALRSQLRALPLITPPISTWPKLQATLPIKAAPAKRQTWPLISALAAGLVLFAFGLGEWRKSSNQAPDVTLSPPATQVLARLISQSQQWESALLQLEQRSALLDAGTALASAKIEDLIGMTDLQLSAAETVTQAESLWQRRIDLMSRLAEVRSQATWQQVHPDQNLALINASYALN